MTCLKLIVISIVPNFPLPTRADQDPEAPALSFPWVLTSAITDNVLSNQAALAGGHCQLVPSRSMAQQRTNNFLPTATIAILRRDFLPPLMRR